MKITATVTGLDKLQRQFEEAKRAIEPLNGTITRLKFDPHDPQSVQRAIQQMTDAVDEKIAPYGNNPLVAKIAQVTKSNLRQQILDRAKSLV